MQSCVGPQFNLNLIIPGKAVHKGEHLATHTILEPLDRFNTILEDRWPENQGHRPLKRSSSVFKAERHFSIRKCSPRTNKCGLMQVLGFNLDLIISGKAVHKGEHLATRTLIQNLIYKWCGEVVLRTGTIQIMEISAYADRSLLLINQNEVSNPLRQGNGIDKTDFQQFLYHCLNRGCFPRIHHT